MMLSDTTIRALLDSKDLVIDPPPRDHQMQPASVDLTLAAQFMSPYGNIKGDWNTAYTLIPNECVLATTAERIELPNTVVARVEGKSSWARKFLMVHSTAGFIDPGFRGQITLELKNLSNVSICLPIGCLIAQVSFTRLDAEPKRPYGSPGLNSHYQNQRGVTASRSPWN